MNVNDFKHIQIPPGDMLEGIFEAQKGLMARYYDIEQARGALVIEPESFGDLDIRFVQWRIKDLMQRCIEEMMEAANTLKQKPWKTSEVATDKVHYYEELADMFHFMVELLITSGMTAKDLAQVYHRKHAVNVFRQDSGY